MPNMHVVIHVAYVVALRSTKMVGFSILPTFFQAVQYEIVSSVYKSMFLIVTVTTHFLDGFRVDFEGPISMLGLQAAGLFI